MQVGLLLVGRTPAAGVSSDVTFNLTRQSADAFRTFGFVVLRRFFDPSPLAAEIDQRHARRARRGRFMERRHPVPVRADDDRRDAGQPVVAGSRRDCGGSLARWPGAPDPGQGRAVLRRHTVAHGFRFSAQRVSAFSPTSNLWERKTALSACSLVRITHSSGTQSARWEPRASAAPALPAPCRRDRARRHDPAR